MEKLYDVIVVGAGTSGMMAAISAAEQGAHVLLIEKNKKAGKKLLMTGGGRCNVTNNRPVDDLIAHIPGNGKFLYSTFAQWNNFDIMNFFESQGVHLKEEDHGRMFPVTNKSKTIIEALLNRLKELDVTLLFSTRVEKLIHKEHKIYGIRTEFQEFHAPAVILTTGGRTYPSTGSTGDGYKIVKRVGHTVTPLYATESPLISDEPYIQEKTLQGLSLQDITLRVLNKKGRVLTEHTMDLLFTHFGISGPAALRCSSFVNKELEKTGEPVTLSLDCFPTQTKQELIHLLTEKSKTTKKNLVNAWHGLLPERLLVFFLERLEMDHLTGQQASQKQIQDFVQLCKEFKLSINKTFPIEKSFVTGGGVSLKEIHPKTLESKIIDGLYFAGELLDVNGYTGGFNITAAFATGHVAGMNAGQRA
ncbi:BaiN/RdsA family NAD(P)/FAD-dependent oxidoreductase [Enterococcus faecium]|uniref:NAD(P)/FAD-dependent oxidoreductase n=1 Tax=Enterococcus faecium TaxID=1352 RepID=UPI000CF26C30|nr:NAD(P)/FAD-dependent oxidoreductase [Enterococcus faecium]EGP5554865.1 NAD(P)/FAD-dependent oxidoreductase [Enterococcus faecium]EKZ0102320.1 NAD(P)/FAD-dependent oxidoreductase [Enterococcus faecium]EMF0280496.1 NAD(P)/FAD-dependent oxidoreductase [Enterococcus faecium]PQE52290.1 aminoacetone oxidase family FAD-binding enzyme [Enterococcus faecium]PQG70385.1 aminoacetone oxidase family FAD-binding enzyme [Enterococcus faecium]